MLNYCLLSCSRTVPVPQVYCCAGLGIFCIVERMQQTRVGNTLSNITNLISGVVQGSVCPRAFTVCYIHQ